MLAPALDIDREAPGWCDGLHQDLAAEETALRWLASLRPAVRVGWLEHGLGVSRVYDPAVEEWADAV